jgi:hypothetical protein
MTDVPEKPVDESASEFISEAEVHRLVAAKLGRDRWRAVLRCAEAEGFPRIDALFGGRSRSKIKRWLDSYNEVANHGVVSEAQDGQENFNAPPKRQARVQAGTPRPALLDRQAGKAGPDGVSGSVHRLADRR